jgi:hypothetical protein
VRGSGWQQDDVARELFDWRMSFDAHPTRTGGHRVQRRLGGWRKADAPRSSGAQVRHDSAADAEQIEDVVQRATDLHVENIHS